MLKLFEKNMKLADIVHTDCRLLYVLPRFGIKLGFGEQTVADACKKHAVSESLLIMVCNIYAFDDYMPKLSELNELPLGGLVDYLKQSHMDYLNSRIPHIFGHIDLLVKTSPNGKLIEQFCDSYKKELIAHFAYEEQVVFPYISSLMSGKLSQGYTIDDFAHNHSNIGDKLSDIKNIIMKYVEPLGNEEEARDLLIDLFLLEEDLERHTLIEEKILIALVELAEKGGK